MKRIQAVILAVMTVSLAGCAGSVSAPTSVMSLSMEQKASLHISNLSADAETGVEVGDNEFVAIVQKVRSYIQAQTPGVIVEPSDQKAYKMNIHFTRFDRGSALARGLLIGLGQIRIEATVFVIDSTGKQVGQYKVSKDFSLGGIAGASTTVEDVEEGFAKSVAEIVKTKT